MSAALDGDLIRLSGACPVEDAETLLALLQFNRQRRVDISAVIHMHAAVIQVLLAFQPPVTGLSADPFMAVWLTPFLEHHAAI